MANDYPLGAVKQDAESHAVAVRSANPADAPNAWAVMHPQHGGHWAASTEVAEWPDVPGTPVQAGDAS
ncbi:hypothetical protein [Mycolicibacterium mageritense]|uniref:hypothetical protein n=1 Tax=Mycolicibacterium mageritense TaxID=53462 RepID=UPI001E6089E0|nr:hypothetical protein [Mycolicibacterium mageritense]GJJ24091.1 hypothetical protein MTY414_77650 [Mycolicibacterium mageritense]